MSKCGGFGVSARGVRPSGSRQGGAGQGEPAREPASALPRRSAQVGQQRLEPGVLAQGREVLVVGHELHVVVPELDGGPERGL